MKGVDMLVCQKNATVYKKANCCWILSQIGKVWSAHFQSYFVKDLTLW